MTEKHITRREFITRAAAAGAAAALPLWGGSLEAAPAKRPNLIFILTDDHRYDAMGFMGRTPFLETPNMDRLAREGATLTNAFVTTALCSPSRASFLTGAYAHRHGVVNNEANDPDPAFETFPQALRTAGYETAYVGKWHMERKSDPRPGFDYWLSFMGQGVYVNPMLNEDGREFQAEGYMTDLLTDYAVKWLEKERDKPFCLILAHKAVHEPFTPAERHKDAFPLAEVPEPESFRDDYRGKPEWQRRLLAHGGGRKDKWIASKDKPVPETLEPTKWAGNEPRRLDYYRALLAVDDSVGRVLETLEEKGILDDTVVAFAGDNGFFQGEHRKGDKRLMYEESIRIPWLIRYPKLIKPGTKIEQMTLNIDLGPTFLDLAGAKAPSTMQGRSMAPLFDGKRHPWRKSFLYEYFREDFQAGIPTMLGVRTEDMKYVSYPDIEDIEELYDLKADRFEMDNLSQNPRRASDVRRMRVELSKLKMRTGYPRGSHPGAPQVD
ncbi:MAG: sulfatase [Armatimonadetes bacterium]|nr:sulfatase [Armatimonadota bacterium]